MAIRKNNTPAATAAIVFAMAISPAIVRAELTRYHITDIGTLGGNLSIGNDINSSGQIVGFSTASTDSYGHGFSYTREGGIRDLGTFGHRESNAYRINDFGQIAGWTDGTGPAFIRQPAGQVDFIASDREDSQARGINNIGQIVGLRSNSPSQDPYVLQAFLYTSDSGASEIDSSWPSSAAYGINNAGQIVGSARLAIFSQNESHAFVHTPGQGIEILETLGGLYGLASSINDAGNVVGSSTISESGNIYHSFLYSRQRGMIDIGCSNCTAADINNTNFVVGQDQVLGAFIYSSEVGLVSLQNLIPTDTQWQLAAASAINDNGQIVGSGRINGETHAFLLTPVPEPSSLKYLLLGLLPFLTYLRRRH